MWIICCRKQERKRKKIKENLKLKQKDSIDYQCKDTDHDDDDDNDNNGIYDHNHNPNNEDKHKNDINIHMKLNNDLYDYTENGYYFKQERRSLPDVVIPSTNLILNHSYHNNNNNLSIIQRPSLQMDYKTEHKPKMMLESKIQLAKSESIGLDDNKTHNNKNKNKNNMEFNMDNKDFLLNKRRAHSLISTYQQQLINNHKLYQSRKSDISQNYNNQNHNNQEKKLVTKTKLNLFKMKSLKRFYKSNKNDFNSIPSYSLYNIINNQTNINTTIKDDLTNNLKMKSSIKSMKQLKLFTFNKSIHDTMATIKDLNNHEDLIESLDDSLGQLPITKNNSIFKHIHHQTRQITKHSDFIKCNNIDYLSNHSNHNNNNNNIVLRRGSLCIFSQIDEPIVTPFAQILASLRKVRLNFIILTNVTSTRE
ncbi:unnamed protein product [Schistosoma margrebowiei]|uniref:3',5'-cyclic-AMP phosphodiesterase n=1 Tax=Schistosoma margrebowiei TaxID=48269 RepID=A0A183NBF5_9TREM|nr:unnamed protein product [Schistosoma margrebowiei]